MKKEIFITGFVLAIISSCTDQGEKVTYNYSIINSTPYLIEIIPYQNPGNGLPEISKKVLIPAGGKFEKITEDSPPYSSGASFQRALYDGYLQKLDIVFNNSRKITYESCVNLLCSDPKNIFHFTHNDENTEVYTITMADYQNAVDCNGNCY